MRALLVQALKVNGASLHRRLRQCLRRPPRLDFACLSIDKSQEGIMVMTPRTTRRLFAEA